jgi:hypothetical protein
MGKVMALARRSSLFVRFPVGLATGFLVLAGFSLTGCDSKQEIVCENVGACAQAGDNDWIKSCQDEAKLLQTEAKAVGCGAPFDDYYSCADSNFDCQGATPRFPGCEPSRAALDACIESAQAQTSCGQLATATHSCASAPDAAAPQEPPACTLLRACEARCYLDQVRSVCAPAVDDLERFTACASSCPP